jgi:hypothetical protein
MKSSINSSPSDVSPDSRRTSTVTPTTDKYLSIQATPNRANRSRHTTRTTVKCPLAASSSIRSTPARVSLTPEPRSLYTRYTAPEALSRNIDS